MTVQGILTYRKGDLIKFNAKGVGIGGIDYSCYAIALEDINGDEKSGFKVVPLRGMAKGCMPQDKEVVLGTRLYELFSKKVNEALKEAMVKFEEVHHEYEEIIYVIGEIEDEMVELKAKLAKEEIAEEERAEAQKILMANEEDLATDVALLSKKEEELSKAEKTIMTIEAIMKDLREWEQGMIAAVGEMMTVNREQIYEPQMEESLLRGIQVDHDDLDAITRLL